MNTEMKFFLFVGLGLLLLNRSNAVKYDNLDESEVKEIKKAVEKVNEVYEATPW